MAYILVQLIKTKKSQKLILNLGNYHMHDLL